MQQDQLHQLVLLNRQALWLTPMLEPLHFTDRLLLEPMQPLLKVLRMLAGKVVSLVSALPVMVQGTWSRGLLDKRCTLLMVC